MYTLCMQHCNLHCSPCIVEHGRASLHRRHAQRAKREAQGSEGETERKRKRHAQPIPAVTRRHGAAVTRRHGAMLRFVSCVSICMFNLPSPCLLYNSGPYEPLTIPCHDPSPPIALPHSAPPHPLTSHFLEYASPQFPTTPSY